ncbi:MAG: DUF4387 domain-containing protein [Lautropia sp.]
MKLRDLARVVRSKNAGPRRLTLDVMFQDQADFQRALGSGAFTAARIARAYGLSEDEVQIVPYAVAHAIKIVLNRRITAGDPGDRDVYGAQQHAPILEFEV